MYEIGELGFLRHNYVRKEALKMLIIGPFFSIIYILLTYFSMSKMVNFFYFIGPVLMFIMIFIFIVAPIRMLRKHNKTIKKICFEDENIIIIVFKALWMEPIEYKLERNKFKIIESSFNWYGKEIRKGLVFRQNGNEFYFVFDYFLESEQIKRLLELKN